MFNFTIRYLGFLKYVPGLPQMFDVWLKLYTFATHRILLDWMDDIERQLSRWPGVKITQHKFGGTQYNYNGKEIGHIHGNGLLDMLLSKSLKQQLIQDGRIQNHHHFKNTGWISCYIRSEDDKDYAIELLRLGYEKLITKMVLKQNTGFNT